MKNKSSIAILAETLGWDTKELSDYRYQRYLSPVVYAIGDQYFAVHKHKPEHDVGVAWEPYSDQFGARDTDRVIWVCKQGRCG